MNCHEVRQHWNLYHDSEGDAGLHFQVNEHLAACAECAEWFALQSRFEDALAEKLRSRAGTPVLWNQVLSRAGLKRPASVVRSWLWLGGMAACVALIGAILGIVNRASPPDLAKLSAAWHQRLATGQEAVQFANESDLEVERYLRKRVAFPVRCPPRQDTGFAVQGAGVGALAEQPAAYLSGHVDDAPVSILILPRDGLASFPRQQAAVRTEPTHHSREGQYAMVLGVIDQNAVLVVGATDPARLEKVLRAYGTYPEIH
ncbi:MAG: zf-HC2 domain-containing protein [Gemmataceae bacterium]|nr:zf-HC2 domain-containing protein [Gemmataceae bacterium]